MLLMTLLAPWAVAQQSLPYEYGFEDNDLSEDGWVKQTTQTNSGIFSSSSASHEGTYLFRFHYSENPGYLITPLLTGTDNGVDVAFYYANYSTSYNEKFQVGYTTDESITDPSAFTYGDVITCTTVAPSYTKYEGTMPNGTKRIAIKYNYTNAYYLYLDDFSFTAAADCKKPQGLTCTSANESSITLDWTEIGTATEWQLCLNGDESNLINVTEKPYTVPGLTSLTPYTVKVRAVCSEYSDWTDEINCSTTAVATPVGDSWSDDFEGASCGWELINGTLTNANWVWGEAVNNGGTHSIYVSNDNGATNSYNASGYAKVYATKLLTFTDGKYAFQFDWKCVGESSYDYLRVGLVPATTQLVADGTSSSQDNPTGWIALHDQDKLSAQSTWTTSPEKAIQVTAGNYYLVLRWRQDSGTQNGAPAAVDNVSITKLACPYDVTDLEPSNITTHTATLTWTAGEATGWEVMWADNNAFENASTQIVSAATIDLSGLSSSSTYFAKVRAYCGGSDYGSWCNAISFDTECEAIDALGYTENFDSSTSGSMPNSCWRRINEGTSYNAYPVVIDNNSYSSPNALRFYCYGNSSNTALADQYAVLPEMTGLDGLQITFMARGYSGDANVIKIGMMEDPTDVSTFELIDTKTLTTSYEEFNINLTGKANYVAFLMEKPSSASSVTLGVYIDNISIHTPPTCIKPTNFVVDASGFDATATWESEESQWQVAYATSATADPNENIAATVDVKTFTANALTIDTDYYFWVRSYCSASDQSDWVGPVSVHIGYCTPAPSSIDGSGIDNVTFGTNLVVNDNLSMTTNPYYFDHSSQIGAAWPTGTVDMDIHYVTNYGYHTWVWVDWDNDMTFSEEEIVFASSSTISSGTLSIQFDIPAKAALGDYRMRIQGADNATKKDPCYTGTYSYLVDYTLRVLEAPSCLTPTGLAVNYTGGTTAEVSWTSNATTWNIDVNGSVKSISENPYTLKDLELATTYEIKVQADCGGSTSEWTNVISFTTDMCMPTDQCELTFELTDAWGDGWNGNYLQVVDVTTNSVIAELTNQNLNGTTGSGENELNTLYLNVCDGRTIKFVYMLGAGNTYPSENSFVIYDVNGEVICEHGSNPTGFEYEYTVNCAPLSCPKPTNLVAGTPDAHSVELSWTENGTATAWQICINGDEANLRDATSNPFVLDGLDSETTYTVKVRAYCDKDDQSNWSNEVEFTTAEGSCAKPTNLAEANITTTSADLSWDGTSDSYVLQYRPWNPAGNDIQTTGTMTTYHVDLSEFSGIGSVAIRHYDVTDLFQLIVDDIVVTNKLNEVVFSEDFESCGGNMPAAFTNMDLDGDGYMWEIAQSSNSNVNGTYGIVSASYDNNVGALTPDNWLIISGLEMGGEMTFQARGQDPNWAEENFAIYISTESSIIEVPLTFTTYAASGLTPNTPYAWQVKGICTEEQSIYVSSFFKTLDDALVFATDGEWTDLDNWTYNDAPATALPTTANNVRIEADATIPAGDVAEANKIKFQGGSIEIEDGGQLKHASASVAVTMYKGITGYGDITNNNRYYFISTPFSGVTLLGNNTWSHINNIEDNTYDLYGFDATNAGAEWINWKSSSSTSSVFVSGNNSGLKHTYGYLYANSEDIVLEFVGTAGPTNVNPTYSITYNPASTDLFNGFVLVGNPFTCNAYVTFATGGTPSAIDFYVMNDEGDGFTLSETNVTLAPMQGAFLWTDADGDVTFSSEIPSSKALAGALNIYLAQDGKQADQARIRFGEGMRLAKASFRDNTSKIYMTENNKDYAVLYTDESGEMPLNFKAETTGEYTISFKLDNANVGYLHLIDKATGEDVNMLTNHEYSFVGSPRDAEDRFIVRFSEMATNNNFAYQNGDQIIVSGEGTLQVYDVMGRFVANYNVNGTESINASQFENAVYIFRLVGTDVKTQKIVIR